MATYSFNFEAAKKAYEAKVKAQSGENAARQYLNTAHDSGVIELVEQLFRYTGQGSLSHQTELFFSRFDRFGLNTLPGNVEHVGLTFFTRPKLPLTAGNLHQVPSLIGLDVDNPSTFAYAIRCWLDTKFSKNGANLNNVLRCPFFNHQSAFNIPLSNACIAQSGWPDPFIQTYTTQGGFFQEDQTFPIGADRLRKTYDLNFTFKETQGGPILAMLYIWYEVMASLAEGSMVAYAEDIDAQRMCYTVSIYRFLLDTSKRHITHYAKATGCFPKAPPMGALFNQSTGESVVEAAKEISVPFVANKIEYDDPRILLDFNMLVTRYCPEIHTYPILRPESYNNFKGFPFVISTQYGLELAFRERLDAAWTDAESGLMVPTTREVFELAEQFYPDKVQDMEPMDLPRGNESRFLYRVVHDPKTSEIMYYFDTDDGYAGSKGNNGKGDLPADPRVLPNNPHVGEYKHEPPNPNDLQEINFTTQFYGKEEGSEDTLIVSGFDPVFVNQEGKDVGTINKDAVKRAISRFAGSNREDVDPNNYIHMPGHEVLLKLEAEQRKKRIAAAKASATEEKKKKEIALKEPDKKSDLKESKIKETKNLVAEAAAKKLDPAAQRQQAIDNTFLGKARKFVKDVVSSKNKS